MTRTEILMEVCRLALAGFVAEGRSRDQKALKLSQSAITSFYATTAAARRKLLTGRNERALEHSVAQLASAICSLPRQCHACGKDNYFSCTSWNRKSPLQMDYLDHCPGTDTFDCALSLLRFRMSAYHGPLVPHMPKNQPPDRA